MAKFTRRKIIKNILGTLLFSVMPISVVLGKDKPQVIAVRVWPSNSYTRITIESDFFIKYNYFNLNNPQRLIIDLSNLEFNEIIKTLPNKVLSSDPYIKQIRIGKYDDSTVRVVIDLKKSITPQVFNINPVANYKNRLVIDLYPTNIVDSDDPLMELLKEYNSGQITSSGVVSGTENTINTNNYDDLDKTIDDILSKKEVDKITRKPKSKTEPPVFSNNNIPKQNKKYVIVLDPGHGGEDPGALGKRLKEKDVVLNIARLTKTQLLKMGYKVYMTRNEDIFIPLRVRVAKARHLKADIFISIHADSFSSDSARGSSIYALSKKGATSSAAQFLAKTQNESDSIGGVKKVGNKAIDNTIFDLTQTATINYSLILGKRILMEIGKINKLHKDIVNQAAFAVLKAPDIPSVLVETAFISSRIEEDLLASSDFRKKIANSIAKGADDFFKNNFN